MSDEGDNEKDKNEDEEEGDNNDNEEGDDDKKSDDGNDENKEDDDKDKEDEEKSIIAKIKEFIADWDLFSKSYEDPTKPNMCGGIISIILRTAVMYLMMDGLTDLMGGSFKLTS